MPETYRFPAESTTIFTGRSVPVPPILLTHWGVPSPKYFNIKVSVLPELVRVFGENPGIFNVDEVYVPETYRFPVTSNTIFTGWSVAVPPIFLAHWGVPSPKYFNIKVSFPPEFVRVSGENPGIFNVGEA